MVTLKDQISQKFITKLSEDETLGPDKIKRLQRLLESDKKPKIDDLVKVFSLPVDGDLK